MVAVLIAGAFTTALNIALISPLVTAIAAEFHRSEAAAGQVATLTATASALTALAVAPWMDRWPRRVWLRIEAILLTVGTVISALAPGFGWLLVGRTVAGIGGAVIFGTCIAATGDLFPDSNTRNRMIGLVTTAATVAGLIGLPVITQIEAHAGWRWAMASILIPLAVVLLGTRWLPGGGTRSSGSAWAEWWSGYRAVLSRSETMWLLGLMVAQAFVWFAWIIYLGAFAEKELAMGAGLISLLFLIGSAGDVLGSNLGPILVRRWRPRPVAAVVSGILAAGLFAVGMAFVDTAALILLAAITGIAGGALFICTNILMLDSYPEGRGVVMSLQSAGLEAGGALGTAAFGAALALSDSYTASYRLLGVAALASLVCLLMSARRAREQKFAVEVPVAVSVEP
jgi:DHA1 family inner membrane transport protein